MKSRRFRKTFPQRRYLMPLIQMQRELILRNNAKIYTATQNLRQKDNLIDNFIANQLADLKNIYKHFSL